MIVCNIKREGVTPPLFLYCFPLPIALLFVTGAELCFFLLIAHWWGVTAAIVVAAVVCVAAIWTGYELIFACDEAEMSAMKK